MLTTRQRIWHNNYYQSPKNSNGFFPHTSFRACYKDWEIDDLKPIIWDDLHRIHPEQRVMDLAQRACWGGPLSNSMFCEYERIDTMTGENLLSFAKKNMRTDCCTVASVGMPFEETLKVAEMVESRRVSIRTLILSIY